ncbi:ABC transporter substrate-binding protein [Paenibacillus sp. CAU 1782]
MKGSRKLASMTLVLVLALTMILSACGSKNDNAGTGSTAAPGETAGSTDKEVTLKMIMLGGKPIDYDQVFGELNTKLKEKVNATLDVEFLDWSDWAQKYPLKFAAQENFDLIYAANWANYNDQASKGGFLELTEELLKEHAPKTFEVMPQAAWDQAKVNGKVYMVPQNSDETIDKVVLIRQDLLEKYNLEPVTSPETFATYLKTVAANEPGVTAYGARPGDGWKWHEMDDMLLEQNNNWTVADISVPLAFKTDDPNGELFTVYETPEFLELLKYYKDLADNGVWTKNVLSEKSDVWQDMLAGKVGARSHNVGTLGLNMVEGNKAGQFKFEVADITPDRYKLNALSTQNGMAVSATSKNVERSLMVIDLLQSDKELHDLIMYGIEGKHYTAVGDDKYSPGDAAPNYTGFSNWGFNSLLNRKDDSIPDSVNAITDAWKEKVYHFPLETFVFDNTNVKNEVANVGNVMLRYGIPLEYGLIDDIEKGRDELVKQLKAAGIEKIKEEMQKQINAALGK